MDFMPGTKSSALRWTLSALIAGCLWEVGINIASAIGGGWGFWLVALGFWLPLSIGLWFRLPISRWVALVILWMLVIVVPLGVINPFAAMDELGPTPPPVWKLIAAVAPIMAASLFAIHILGKYKDEFCSPPPEADLRRISKRGTGVSHDLAFFAHTPGISEADVRAAYRAYCGGTGADSGRESLILTEFVGRLEARYPSLAALSDAELDGSPWSSEFDRGPTHLIVCMAFSRAVEVGQYIWELLQKHSLVVYDPQADQAFFGADRLPPLPSTTPRPWWRLWK